MKGVYYLNLEEVTAIHHDQINRYGGSHGVRDLNLLLSAVSRPQASFGGGDLYPDLFTKAAALLHSVIMNHSFIDGNKRTGAVAVARFLFINGYKLEVSQEELVQVALKTESGKWDIEKISSWFKKHSRKM